MYGGEIKKALFTAMNYLLPERNVLPMHCSATAGKKGDVALYFGLSGTGKTTLSADPARRLIGDDEHGWSDHGVFNLEGGCYAKVISLSPVHEPQIFNAIRFGSILENVIIDPLTRAIDWDDDSITENTRATYPVNYIPNAIETGLGGMPRNVFLLACDAYGVLPPISRLTPEMASYHFLSGFTAKVAGTEAGVTEPEPTFSACFGAPFMPRDPVVYADMLAERLRTSKTQCWLVNTGWCGGSAAEAERMPIEMTRSLLKAALEGSLDGAPMTPHPVFGVEVPFGVPGRLGPAARPEVQLGGSGRLRPACGEAGGEVRRQLRVLRRQRLAGDRRSRALRRELSRWRGGVVRTGGRGWRAGAPPMLPALLTAAALLPAALLSVAALLLAGCGGSAPSAAGSPAAPPAAGPSASASASARPAVVISDREGPSWSGELGETVQIDWYDQTTGKAVSEQVAVLEVRRLPSPDDGSPTEYGGGYGPYEWKYGIKVRLTSLDARTARQPLAYQFLQLRDGRDSEDGVAGLGRPGGPDPSRPGRSSVGWLYQWAEQGFTPTQVTLPVGSWRATWSLH